MWYAPMIVTNKLWAVGTFPEVKKIEGTGIPGKNWKLPNNSITKISSNTEESAGLAVIQSPVQTTNWYWCKKSIIIIINWDLGKATEK